MSKKKQRQKTAPLSPAPQVPAQRARGKLILVAALLVVGLSGIAYAVWRTNSSSEPAVNLTNPTFARDVAPLIYKQCAGCHHTGGSAPFALLTYADVSKRAQQIATVTGTRYMPPWLPAHGHGDFVDARYLSDAEIQMLKTWAAQGAPEGDAAHTPAPPQFAADWQLGKPDLIVQLPRAYTLPAEGRDIYRNFVVPVPLSEDKFVKGIEFRAGSSRIHHALVYLDSTPASRKREAREHEPGWPGMGALPSSVQGAGSQFTNWLPGKTPRLQPESAWKLAKGTDLVLQLHMQPGGKPEPIQPSIGLYFTDRPGPLQPMQVLLRSVDLDIPAGEKAYIARAQYTVPVEVKVLGLLPHVHYLGKDLRAFATLPDGEKKWLLWIKDWNFDWQGDYVFKQPVLLPQGSRIEMEYTFDNSAGNPRNPNQPPKRVRYGLQSTDEMAELWLLMLPNDERDWPLLRKDRVKADMADSIAKNTAVLRIDSTDAHAHLQLGKVYMLQGRTAEAETHLRSAIKFDDASSDAHYSLAYLLQDRIKDRATLRECIEAYRRSIQLDRDNYEALNGLGVTFLQAGMAREAEMCLLEGLRVRPNDPLLLENLALARKALGR